MEDAADNSKILMRYLRLFKSLNQEISTIKKNWHN